MNQKFTLLLIISVFIQNSQLQNKKIATTTVVKKSSPVSMATWEDLELKKKPDMDELSLPTLEDEREYRKKQLGPYSYPGSSIKNRHQVNKVFPHVSQSNGLIWIDA